MDFFTTVQVIDKRYNKGLKIFMWIICILDIMVVAIELLTNGFVGALYVIPLIYLIPSTLKMGEKVYPSDVLSHIDITDQNVFLTMSRVIIEKDDIYDREYYFNKDRLEVLSNPQTRKIALVGDGIVRIINQDKVIAVEERFNNEIVELTLKETTFREMESYLNSLK